MITGLIGPEFEVCDKVVLAYSIATDLWESHQAAALFIAAATKKMTTKTTTETSLQSKNCCLLSYKRKVL